MNTPKKPIKKVEKPTTSKPTTSRPKPIKTIVADDFDDNPATIMRNGGKVKKKTGGKVITKMYSGGKMKRGC